MAAEAGKAAANTGKGALKWAGEQLTTNLGRTVLVLGGAIVLGKAFAAAKLGGSIWASLGESFSTAANAAYHGVAEVGSTTYQVLHGANWGQAAQAMTAGI